MLWIMKARLSTTRETMKHEMMRDKTGGTTMSSEFNADTDMAMYMHG